MLSPYRCLACRHRFFRLSDRLPYFLVLASVLGLIVTAIVISIYVIRMDPSELTQTVSTPASTASAAGANTAEGEVKAAPAVSANDGDAKSQYERGMQYLRGDIGVAKNPAEASKWLELAANQGHADASYNLGVLYRAGQGVLQNFETAFQWFELAAKQNHAEAQYSIGLMYQKGQSVQVDLVKSYVWLNLAAAQGHAGATGARNGVLQVMTAQQVADGQRGSRDWRPVGYAAKQPERALSVETAPKSR